MEGSIKLSHGSGGKETSLILKSLILSALSDEEMSLKGGVGLKELDDGAAIPLPDGTYLVVSIDAYTVNPPFFPGGEFRQVSCLRDDKRHSDDGGRAKGYFRFDSG